ncbi:MAG: MBL fold metallo-hydrolase [Bacteroidales bacterium]
MITIKTFVFNPFQENTYVISDDTGKCIVLDPGCYFENEQNDIRNYIKQNNLTPENIVYTHGHIDHVIGTNFLKNAFSLKAIMHKEDIEILRSSSEFAESIGLDMDQPSDPESYITENERITIGNTHFNVYHAPGHSPGSIILHNAEEKILFSGDVLFRKGIGRSDLPGGDYDTLINSIKEKILNLDEDTTVYPGHGETTTIFGEKNQNPFLV